ncbi:MAG: VOC family protein [Haliangiales bacterium]
MDEHPSAAALLPFHLAFPVTDLDATRRFYCELLGCRVGRESERWIDLDFFGHQLTAHLVASRDGGEPTPSNSVDAKEVPIPHFGAVLPWDDWHQLAARVEQAGVEFVIAPYIRFAGQVGEQATMFFCDPSGNHIELKSFKDPRRLFQA